jgi:hypothetical protein
MARAFVSADEGLQIRRYGADPREEPGASPARKCQLGTMLKDVTHDDAGHGLAWCAWNGDRARGWTFYCACGYCTRMTRSFEDGLDLMEKHWQYRASEPMAVPMQDPRCEVAGAA